jgi:hypothetical protein
MEVPMDAPNQPVPTQPVQEISLSRLATAIFSALALMFSFGALVVAADDGGSGNVQGGSVKSAGAVLEGSAIPATATAVKLTEFKFDPTMVMVGEGGALKITNSGAAPHTLGIDGTDLVTPELGSGDFTGLSLASLSPGN